MIKDYEDQGDEIPMKLIPKRVIRPYKPRVKTEFNGMANM